MDPECLLDLCWNFRLLSFSGWPWRRLKDFNPQWNFLIPATCHHVHWLHRAGELLVGVSPQQGNSPSSLTTQPEAAAAAFGFLQVFDTTELWRYGNMPSVLFPWQKVRQIGGPKWPAQTLMLFLFSVLRTFGIYRRPHKGSPHLYFLQSPLPQPLFEPAGLPHIYIKMRSWGSSSSSTVSLLYSSNRRGAISVYISMISSVMRDLDDKMLLAAYEWCEGWDW